MNLINPIISINRGEIPYVDEWIPSQSDKIFDHGKNYMVLPVNQFYGTNVNGFDHFIVSRKKCYNGLSVRNRVTHYLNYFLKYYDHDKELLMIYYRMKYCIDFESDYYVDAFKYDVETYLLSPSIRQKITAMNIDNYRLNLDDDTIDNKSLQYTDVHGKIMMEMSIMMNILIPITSHFIYVKGIKSENDFFLEVYDIIFDLYSDHIDIYNKLYETASSTISRLKSVNQPIWDMQAIRSMNATTHILDTIENIILNVMPKYVYNMNIVKLNVSAIRQNHGWQITDIAYSHSFVPLSSSQRDENDNSKFDKYESFLVREDESLFIQNKVNCEEAMNTIEMQFGPFDEDEISFYKERMDDPVHGFQRKLVFGLFYKYFGDPVSIKAINQTQYIKLVIAAKRYLESHRIHMLSYVISSNITRFVNRKSLNKREERKVKASNLFINIQEKYNNPKIEKDILSIIASILSSDFEIIDYHNKEADGQQLDKISDIICEEVLLYISLI